MAYAKHFSIVEDKIPQKLGPQPDLIVRDLMDHPASTVKQISDRIKNRLQTRQDPERVVSFYMSTWKKKGIVLSVEKDEEAPVSTGTSSETISEGDIASFTPDELIGKQDVPAPLFDFAGSTLKAALIQVLKMAPKPMVIMDIHQELQVKGREVKVKAVADGISKLFREGMLEKNDDGMVSLRNEVHA